MAIDPRKRQKKQERRAAKRKTKQHQLARERSAGLPERLAGAARYPILHAQVTTDFWDQGIGWACLSRELPNGSVGFGLFLVDRYCLGIKNVMADITGRFTYDTQVARKFQGHFKSKEMKPAAVRKLVEQAVAYARSLGFPPHPEYQRARLIFGDIDPNEAPDEFEFGKDGKPYFIAGPHDTPERCRHILRTLEEHCGPDGYHYLIPMAGDEEILPLAPDEEGDYLEDQD